MTYAITDKNGNSFDIEGLNLAGRSTVTRPSDVVVSFVSKNDLPLAEYDVKPSIPHDSLKIITRVRITNKVARGNGAWSYVTTAVH
jgi:hypothetical protein